MLHAQFLRLDNLNLALPGIFFNKIQLVTHKHYADITFRLGKQGIQPKLNIFECLSACNVINDQSSECFPVMSNGNSAVLFLTSRVPNLSFDCSSVLHYNILCCKLNTNCRFNFAGQLILHIATQQTSFAHIDISNQDNFKEEVTIYRFTYSCRDVRDSVPYFIN